MPNIVCRCINWREGKCCQAGAQPSNVLLNTVAEAKGVEDGGDFALARDWQWEAQTLRRLIDEEREQTRREHEEADAKLDAVYTERNALAVAFATAMQALGYRAGYGLDQDADADWPVLYVSTPAGQVSWHIPKAEAAHSRIALGVYGQPWDGHSTELKYQRLASLNPCAACTADLRHGVRTRLEVE